MAATERPFSSRGPSVAGGGISVRERRGSAALSKWSDLSKANRGGFDNGSSVMKGASHRHQRAEDANQRPHFDRLGGTEEGADVEDEWSYVIIDDPSHYQAAAPETGDLYNRVGDPWSPMAHPDWVRAWWETVDARVMCFTARHNGRLAACIPMQFARERYAGIQVNKASSTNLSWGWSSALVDPSPGTKWSSLFCHWLAKAHRDGP